MVHGPIRPHSARLVAWLLPALLAACGGGDGGGSGSAGPATCTVAEHKAWLGSYMNDWYFWYRISPRPDAAAFADVDGYFDALLYTGGPDFPSDRYSGSQSTESFNRFYGDGATLGYGVAVAGLELARDGTRPLRVRHVEPLSPAATAGVRRGDRVRTINGRAASELVAADDLGALSAQLAGDTLDLELSRGDLDFSVSLRAAVYTLTPVTGTAVISTAGGRRLGYVAVKDMIGQAQAPLESAFARFRAEGVQDLVLDLRYNGGGLVSLGGTLASLVAGSRASGLTYASLLYNDKRAASNNQRYAFSTPSQALDLPRVFVLMGRRTCSASEQVINGLRGANVQVVAIGETSCGKPVGFLPTSACGRTYSVVNFESVNQRTEGRYFDGFAPTCEVTDDVGVPQGAAGDPLTEAARTYADSGLCPALPAFPSAGRAARAQALGLRPGSTARTLEEGDRAPGMVAR